MIRQLEIQRDALPRADLNSLTANVRDYDRKAMAFTEKEADWQAKQDRTQHYLWVKHATETYQDATRGGSSAASVQPSPLRLWSW